MLNKAPMQPKGYFLRQRTHEPTRARETPQNRFGCRRRSTRRPGTGDHDLTRRGEREYAARSEHARREYGRHECGRECARHS